MRIKRKLFMKYDIAVIGAGPAGLSFVQALSDTSLKIAVIESLCPCRNQKQQ